jgi:hypothetical protein
VRDGWTPIEDLNVGDEVLSVDPASGEACWTTIREIRSAHRECVRLSTSQGQLVCTSDHPVWSVERGEFSDAGNWALGYLTQLTRWSDDALESVEVSNTSVFAGVNEVFDLVLDDDPHTFVADGFLVHNKDPACDPASGQECACPDGRMSTFGCHTGCQCEGTMQVDTGNCDPSAGTQCVCPNGVRSTLNCDGACTCATEPDMSRDMAVTDVAPSDGGMDGGADMTGDAASDASFDSGADTANDASTDGGADADAAD